MRLIHTLALALIASVVGSAALAQQKIKPDQWLPKAQRPYGNQEIYFQPEVFQKVPQIRVTRIEAAYRQSESGGRLKATEVCQAFYTTLRKSKDGAAVRDYGCKPGVGWAVNPSPNSAGGALVAHYKTGATINDTVSMVITVCEAKETYDPQQHICVGDETRGGNGN